VGRQLDRRICRLEAACSIAPNDSFPRLIVCEVGETVEAAIARTYGPAGLPARLAGAPPDLIIVPVSKCPG
jgi:hypothetical protein